MRARMVRSNHIKNHSCLFCILADLSASACWLASEMLMALKHSTRCFSAVLQHECMPSQSLAAQLQGQAQQHLDGFASQLWPTFSNMQFFSSQSVQRPRMPSGPQQSSTNQGSTAIPKGSLVEATKAKLKQRLQQQIDPGMRLELPSNPFQSASSRIGPAVPRQILYRGPGMLLFRFLVRAKVFQILGVFTGVILVSTMLSSPGSMQPMDLLAIVAVLVGCVVTSYCLWFYSSRYVGEMSLLLPDRRIARISVLDFWGNRKDVDVPVELIQPPFKGRSVAQVKEMVKKPLLPISVTDDRQYYISVRHGTLREKEVLQKICYGTWLSELESAKHGVQPGSQPAASDTNTSPTTQCLETKASSDGTIHRDTS